MYRTVFAGTIAAKLCGVRVLGCTLLALFAGACNFAPVGAAVPIDAGTVAFDDAAELADVEEAVDAITVADAELDASAPDAAEEADAAPEPDASERDAGVPVAIPHLSDGEQLFGDGDLVFDENGFLNTTELTLPNATLPPGASFLAVSQANGPELAVLRVGTLTVNGYVRVAGTRPLVIVARGRVVINNGLDGSARESAPGGGGSLSSDGAGRGGDANGTTESDSGGGGAGFGTAGAEGGATNNGNEPGGDPGASFGAPALPILVGGSGGGRGSGGACNRADGGGGGGAIQIYSLEEILIASTGKIGANGGGGRGGIDCGEQMNSGGGSGGGSGGAVHLVAPRIVLDGWIAANGGAGGGGATSGAGSGQVGKNGPFSLVAPLGGMPAGGSGRRGGNGATRSIAPEEGEDHPNSGNGGGGGGGLGRVLIVTAPGGLSGTGTTSPAAMQTTY